MKTTTIRVTEQTKQRLANLAKWGEPLEDVIIKLLNSEQLTKEKVTNFYNYLLNLEKERDIRGITPITNKFKETFKE